MIGAPARILNTHSRLPGVTWGASRSPASHLIDYTFKTMVESTTFRTVPQPATFSGEDPVNVISNALLAAALVLAIGFNATAEPLTYTKDIAPIINENCLGCHRPGQSGPMSLRSYKEVRPWAKSIRKQVSEKTMPPWHASESKVALKNDRSLSQEEVDKIVSWVDSGVVRPGPPPRKL